MYSAFFAMTAIIVIAATNLFLGFATAILMGRGPKRWTDVEESIVLHPVVIQRPRRAPSATVERVDLDASLVAVSCQSSADSSLDTAAAPEFDAEASPNGAAPETNNVVEANRAAEDAMPTPPQPVVESPPQKLVLPPRDPVRDESNDPPEKTLNRQLEAWRHGDLSGETPSISGVKICVDDDELDETGRAALADAVHQRVKSQVRKDRRVLHLGSDQFVWFSADVAPDDALMPVERIRQMLVNTRFQRDGRAVSVTVMGAVVAVLQDDNADSLLKRLASVFNYASAQQQATSCQDVGHGPERTEPHQFEVEAKDCEF